MSTCTRARGRALCIDTSVESLPQRSTLAEVVRVCVAVRAVENADLGLRVGRVRRKRVQRRKHRRRLVRRLRLAGRAQQAQRVAVAHAADQLQEVVLPVSLSPR